MKTAKTIACLFILCSLVISCEYERKMTEEKLIGSWEKSKVTEILLAGGIDVVSVSGNIDGEIDVEIFEPEIWSKILATEYGSELESNLESLEFKEEIDTYYADHTIISTYDDGEQSEYTWRVSEDGMTLYIYISDSFIGEIRCDCDIVSLTSTTLELRLSQVDGETPYKEIDLDNDQINETIITYIMEVSYSKLSKTHGLHPGFFMH